ncbi:MAG: glycine cleavage system protein H [Chloroflexi bacterium]|nr:glycine cleavage system protein H [Chloroflexota bacterium]
MSTNTNYTFPKDLYYDRATHIWARYDDETVTIGLDALGLESLGDMAYISLQAVGLPVQRGESIGSLEAAKMVGDVIAPVGGVIAARNEDVLRDPSLINRDPYGAGWILQITPSAWDADSEQLVHGAGVSAWVESEIERYRSQGWIE